MHITKLQGAVWPQHMTTLSKETKIPWFGLLIKEKKTIIDDNDNGIIIIIIIIIIINEDTSPFSSIPSLEIFFSLGDTFY